MVKITNNEVILKLLEENNAYEFYRFQGHNSFEYYNIRTNRFESNLNHYVYFSTTLSHHYYFTIKRIRQLINTTILKNTPYEISRKQLNNSLDFSNIKKLVINSENIKGLNSIALVCDYTYYDLLKDSCMKNLNKTYQGGVERVDRRVYGGGYGVTGAWLDLFNDLVYFSSYTRFNVQDILDLLEKIKNGNSQASPKLIQEILKSKLRTYQLSKNLYDDFHKYKIMEDLDRIESEKLFLPGSEFAKSPQKTKKLILSTYQQRRDKILSYNKNKFY